MDVSATIKVSAKDKGYREVKIFAEFMLKIAENGIPDGDVAKKFGYDSERKGPYVETYDGKTIYASDLECGD